MESEAAFHTSNLPYFHPSNPLSFHPLFDEAFLYKLERLSILSRRAMAGQLQGERRSPKRGQSVTSVALTGMPTPVWNAFSSSSSSKRRT